MKSTMLDTPLRPSLAVGEGVWSGDETSLQAVSKLAGLELISHAYIN